MLQSCANGLKLGLFPSNELGSPWVDGFLREKKTVPQLDEHRTVIGVYVDNITILGRCKDDVKHRAALLQRAFDQAGIPISWTQEDPSSCLDSVGCVLDLRSGILMNKPKRIWNFVRSSSALLRPTEASWTGAACKYGLVILQHCVASTRVVFLYWIMFTGSSKKLYRWEDSGLVASSQ